jgi:hypothetical protein
MTHNAPDPIVLTLHKKCYANRAEVERLPMVACFFCVRYFDPSEMTEWMDGGITAMCPRCGIDSVIPADGVSPGILQAMNDHWFGTPIALDDSSGLPGPDSPTDPL